MNYTFLKDITTEKKGGKYSSKKIWGHIILLLVGVTYILDGFGYYHVNSSLFNTMVISGTTLIGLRTIASLFKKKSTLDGTK